MRGSQPRWPQGHCDIGSAMTSCRVWVGSPSLLYPAASLFPSSHNMLIPQLPELGDPLESQVVATSAEVLLEAEVS